MYVRTLFHQQKLCTSILVKFSVESSFFEKKNMALSLVVDIKHNSHPEFHNSASALHTPSPLPNGFPGISSGHFKTKKNGKSERERGREDYRPSILKPQLVVFSFQERIFSNCTTTLPFYRGPKEDNNPVSRNGE